MSIFVELPRNTYPDNALDAFTPTPEFKLDNARAMMWLSQLAYETADESKVDDILKAWDLTKLEFISNDQLTGLPRHSACVVVAAGHGAIFVTFAGSDPLKIEDWITDFNAVQTADDLHAGFNASVETVWPKIKAAIGSPAAAGPPLFFAGHSLGGALAVLAATRAAADFKTRQKTVYTFGSPRTGGSKFFSEYSLGASTFRLIHGTDIVPTVPASQPGDYRHVGRSFQCQTDGIFDDHMSVTAPEGNKPDFINGAIQAGLSDIHAFMSFRSIHGIGPAPLDQLAGLLPRMVRDHVPANYFRALSIIV